MGGNGRTELMRRVSRVTPTPTPTPKVTPKTGTRKTSLEGIVKHLTNLAVTISDGSDTGDSSTPLRRKDKKLKRTNLMKRRESQALLEGVRKNRGLSGNADSDASLTYVTNEIIIT